MIMVIAIIVRFGERRTSTNPPAITSGGYGHCIGKSIALGYIPPVLAAADEGFEMSLLATRRSEDARNAIRFSRREN